MTRSGNTSVALAAGACFAVWAFVTYGGIDPRFWATVFAGVAVVAYFYTRKAATDLPGKRPRLAWMPKYRCRCEPSASVLSSPDPARALVLRLGELGFVCERQTPLALHFSRGHAQGDFSVELAKLDVTVSLPIESSTELLVEAGWVAAFDTGDLWQLTTELKALVESDSPPAPDGSDQSG